MSIPRSLDVLLAALLAGAVALPAWAADGVVDQRRRIAEQRAAVEARAQAAQAACAEQFAVTACVDRVKAERRESLQRLDREVAALDAEERKRRAAQRLQRIEQRQSAASQSQAAAVTRPRSAKAVEVRERGVQSPIPQPPAVAAQPRTAASAADARAAQRAAAAARRASEASAHRAAVEARNREREKQRAPAKPLPLPSAAN